MMRKQLTLLLVLPALLLGGCEIGTKVTEQQGPNGAAISSVKHKAGMPVVAPVPEPPYPLDAAMLEGARAKEVYQNVQVLGDISADEFNYTMAALTNWVAPADGTVENGGCNYCHNPANMASDELYTKVVARKMLQMTRNINANWTPHFNNNYGQGNENAGVTCWTCHRGKPVPANNWSAALPDPGNIKGNKLGQNTPLKATAYASLPYDSFSSYLAGSENIRVGAKSAYPTDHAASIVNTEKTYGLMMHMSQGLGVNCTFCHNSNNFAKWSDSRTQRVNAWYGIRMVRDINNNYITALGDVWPANRRGPAGDPLKVNCATCHNGINRPMGGAKMLKDYPSLKGAPAATLVAAPAAAAPDTAAPEAAPASPPVAAAEDATKPAA